MMSTNICMRLNKSRSKGRPFTVAVLFALTPLLGACAPDPINGSDVELVTVQPASTVPAPSTVAPNPDCGSFTDATAQASYPPAAAPSPSPALDRIRAKGKLVVGVSADTLLFGFRNPATGKLEGFDIDILRELTKSIFPDKAANPDDAIQFRVITYANRLPLLESREIDAVAHTMTINCRRWNRIAFSSEYYTAGQKLVVKKGNPATGIETMPNNSVICVPSGGTSQEQLAVYTTKKFVPVEVNDVTECLVLLQQGKADGVLSDNTVGEGFAKQDPYVEVVGEFVSTEPYGLGFNVNDTDLVQLTNHVLEELRKSGGMQRLLEQNSLSGNIPVANHSRTLP
jgi:polar amino acid transport system substrate-binding protein